MNLNYLFFPSPKCSYTVEKMKVSNIFIILGYFNMDP